MISVTITGLQEAIKAVKSVEKQAIFAGAKACNDVAKAVQDWTLKEHLPKELTLRSKGQPWQRPGSKYGFNIRFAKKSNPVAVLGSQADWLKLVEFGGIKSRDGMIAIPTREWKRKEDLMVRTKKPRAVLRQKRAFSNRAFVYAGSKMPAGIYARKGEGQYPIMRLFTLKEHADVKATLNWETKAGRKAMELYPHAFEVRFEEAMRTAK